MARDARHHLPPGEYEGMPTRQLTKQEFARRLTYLMNARGWNQSELARRAGVGRDAVSSYVRARSFPEPANLSKLASAFKMGVDELLPNATRNAISNDVPSLEIREAFGHQGKVWLQVNQLVTRQQALTIMRVLTEDPHMD